MKFYFLFLGSKLYYNSVKLKDNNTKVVCRATDSLGETIEATATLFVYPKENAAHPAILTGPADVDSAVLSDVDFTCSAYGEFKIKKTYFFIIQCIYRCDGRYTLDTR